MNSKPVVSQVRAVLGRLPFQTPLLGCDGGLIVLFVGGIQATVLGQDHVHSPCHWWNRSLGRRGSTLRIGEAIPGLELGNNQPASME